MTNVKISELPAAITPLSGNEELPLVQSGVTRKALVSSIIGAANQVVDTINDLKATPVTSGAGVSVNNYATSGDGGGGYFYGVTGAAPGTYVDNGGTIIVPTGGDGSSAWIRQVSDSIDVLMFGADPTGTNSSSAAFQAAINALGQQGGTVLIPAGKFYLATSIVVKPAVSLKGPYEYIGRTYISYGEYQDWNYLSALRVAPAATIYLQGGGGISGCLIIPPPGVIPGTESSQWKGTAVTVLGRGMLPEAVRFAVGTGVGVWSGGSLTITHNGGYAYPVGKCITLNRTAPSGYTGMYTVVASTSNTVTVSAPDLGAGDYFLIQQDSRGFISNIVPKVKTVTGSVAWASSTATLTFSASTPFAVGDLIEISDVTPSGYNGTYKVTAATATSVSFYLPFDPGIWTGGGLVGNATITHNMPINYALSEMTSVNISGVSPSSYNGSYTISETSTITTVVIPTTNTDSFVSGGVIAIGYSGTISNMQPNTPSAGLMTITHNTGQIYPVESTVNVSITSPRSLSGAYTVKASTDTTVTVASSTTTAYINDGYIESPCEDIFVKDSMILGFNYGIYGIGTDRITLTDLKIDCQNGIFLAASYDESHIARVHLWPFAVTGEPPEPKFYGRNFALTLGAANLRNDWPTLVDCFCYGFNRGYWLCEAASATLIGCNYDGSPNNMSADSTAFLISNFSSRNTIDNSYIATPSYGVVFDTSAAVGTLAYNNVSNVRVGISAKKAFAVDKGTVKFFGCSAENSPISMQVGASGALAYGSGFSVISPVASQAIAGEFCLTWSGGISTIKYATTTTPYYSAGDTIIVSGVTNPSAGVNGTYTVTSCTATSVSYTQAVDPKYRISLSASLTIASSGTLSLTLPTGLNWVVGSTIIIGTTSGTPGSAYYYMFGTLATYNSSTGAATFTIGGSGGSGTYSTWNDVGPWPPTGNVSAAVLGTLNPMGTIIT